MTNKISDIAEPNSRQAAPSIAKRVRGILFFKKLDMMNPEAIITVPLLNRKKRSSYSIKKPVNIMIIDKMLEAIMKYSRYMTH